MRAAADSRPHLSIIVTSYSPDRLPDLWELLDSLQRQSYRETEIVFVGEGGGQLGDRVRAYAEGRGISDLRVAFNDGSPGCSAARDIGLRQARGEIVAFIDDDAVAPPDWAEQIVRAFADETVVAVTGPALPLWVEERGDWLPQELYWIIGCTGWAEADGLREVRNVWGMNMAFRRAALELIGGFSQELGAVQGRRLHGEEVELSLRLRRDTGQHVIYNPQVRVMHKAHGRRLSAQWIAKTSFWVGYTRHLLRALSRRYGVGDDFLAVERRLLGRVVTGLLPRTLLTLFLRPRRGLRTLWILMLALSFVALGYLSHGLLSFMGSVRALARQKGREEKKIIRSRRPAG